MLIDKFEEVEKLDEAIRVVLERMSMNDPDSDEYAKMNEQLSKLVKTKEIIAKLKLSSYEAEGKQKQMDAPDRVSKDTLALIGANIAGIMLIIGYERFNVVASKALGLIIRAR